MKFLICLTLAFVTNLSAKQLLMERYLIDPDSTTNQASNIQGYSIPDSVLTKFPFRNQNYLNRFYPGVVSYFQNFYIRGGKNYETGFYLDRMKFNDLFTGENSFFINPDVFERIDFYNGFLPTELGNSSSGLFNYELKTGGDKLNFNVEHQTDNITFTNDAFSGNKRLGTYYYGYNETNFNFSGPLYFNNVRLFANVNYLFQKDKNPQRYPGIDNVTFTDQQYGDSITINLPAGIVPFNSFESINFLSTLLFEFDRIKIKVFGIYFDQNEFTERNHILEYLNPRLGLIDKSGGIVNLNFEHKINDKISYSLGANYFRKNEMTTDQYLGDNYWSYGDSVANAEAGIYWQRDNWLIGRYTPPGYKRIMFYNFIAAGYPGIDHQKSDQQKFSFNGNIRITFNNHLVRIGGEFHKHQLKKWQLGAQEFLARQYAEMRDDTLYQELSEEELKELIAIGRGVNNFGYDPIGREINSGLDRPIEPLFLSAYIDDQFNILDNLSCYLGLRYDDFDFDYKKMIEPAAPEKTFDVFSDSIIEEGLIDTKNFVSLSPKAYIKFAPLENLLVTADYSQNVQSYPFSEIYIGVHSTAYFSNLYGGGIIGDAGFRTGDLEPIISKGFEFSVLYKPTTILNTCLTYYNKKTENFISLEYQKTNPSSSFFSYYYYGFNGEMNTEGLELLLDYYFNGLTIYSTLNYQNAEELSYKAQSDIFRMPEIIINHLEPQQSNRFYFNLLLDYNFEHLNELSDIFDGLNLSTMFFFNDGHPFEFVEIYNYYPVQPVPERTPTVFQTDLKIEKRFKLFSQLNFGIYIYAINLFDNKNVFNVFSTSGSAEYDGYDFGSLLQTYDEQMIELHKLINLYNPVRGQQTFYGPPRQIGFGIKLNY